MTGAGPSGVGPLGFEPPGFDGLLGDGSDGAGTNGDGLLGLLVPGVVIENVTVADAVTELFVPVIVTEVGVVAVGVPEITPVDALMVTPAGNAGEAENVAEPKFAVKPADGVIGVPVVPVTVNVDGVKAGAAIENDTVADAVTVLFVPVIVTDVGVVAVGVPEITPDDAFNDNPAGKAGEAEKVAEPKFAVKPDDGVTGTPVMPVTVNVDGVKAGAAIENVTFAEPVTVLFVPVIVTDPENSEVAVPEICPVEELNTKPSGRADIVVNDVAEKLLVNVTGEIGDSITPETEAADRISEPPDARTGEIDCEDVCATPFPSWPLSWAPQQYTLRALMAH